MLLDGKTGDVIGKLGEGGKAHAGGIYSVSGLPCAGVGGVRWLALCVMVVTVCDGWHCV